MLSIQQMIWLPTVLTYLSKRLPTSHINHQRRLKLFLVPCPTAAILNISSMNHKSEQFATWSASSADARPRSDCRLLIWRPYLVHGTSEEPDFFLQQLLAPLCQLSKFLWSLSAFRNKVLLGQVRLFAGWIDAVIRRHACKAWAHAG